MNLSLIKNRVNYSKQSLQKKDKKKNEKNARTRIRGLVYVSVYLSLLPTLALADLTDTLNNFLGYLTGDVGKAVAAIAIVGVGFGCFGMGKIPKGYVIAVVVGVGIIFGAKALLGVLGG